MPPEIIVLPVEETSAHGIASDAEPDTRPFWEIIAELGEQIPAEDRSSVPHDGGKNYKRCLYGTPKAE